MSNKGYVAEIFPSIQGEGLWIGQHQLFLRLAGCSYNCQYCDTEWAQIKELARAAVYFLPITKKNTKLANPVTVDELAHLLEEMWLKLGPFHSLAITGGEPLEQPDFLLKLLKEMKKLESTIKVMLETNGIYYTQLKKVLSYIDFVSMDIKLKSATGINMPLKRHKQFLELIKNKAGHVKIVVAPSSSTREIIQVAKMINATAPELELVIQPVMKKRFESNFSITLAYNLMKVAMNYHDHVRIIPQMHKYAGLA